MKITPDASAPNGTNFELTQEEFDAGLTHVVMTGPISGTLALSTGNAYDVTPDYVAIHPEEHDELTLAIHKAHHAAGRFLDAPLPAS